MKANLRYEQLDSLRGIAALCVVFLHISLIFPETQLSKILLEFSPLRLLVSGSEAVILFFVLSGFVLSLPFYKDRKVDYLSFLVKRIVRIYTPYLLTLFLTVLCVQLFYKGNIEGLSKWFNVMWSGDVTLSGILDHAILIKTFMSNLNPVIWSLVHEMRISIIFPVIMLILVKMNWQKGIVFGAGFSVISIILFQTFKVGNDGVEFINTLHYISIFIVGALVAKYFSQITAKVKQFNKPQKLFLFGFGMMMYLYAKPSFVIAAFIYPEIAPFYRTVLDSWFVAVGSIILIVFAISSNIFSRILSIGFIKYLGKISYSLYLSHIFVILTMFQLLYGHIPTILIVIISAATAILISGLMYRYVEMPSIEFGKKMAERIKQLKNKKIKSIPEVVVK